MSSLSVKSIIQPLLKWTILSTTGASVLYCGPSTPPSTSLSSLNSTGTISSSTSSSSRPTFDPCPEIACKSKEELAALFGERKSSLPRRLPSATAPSSNSSSPSASIRTSSETTSSSKTMYNNNKYNNISGYAPTCPPDREELGYHSWNLLHTMAAYYPDHPTTEDIDAAKGLIKAITYLYPCKHCRSLWVQDTTELPPVYTNRQEFALWLCEQHNRVNVSLGKPIYPCNITALDTRWRTGRPECWGETVQTATESLGQGEENDNDDK